MRQIGGANVVIPVACYLQERGVDVVFYSQGVAYDRFKFDFPLISAESISPDKLLGWLDPDVVLSECVAPEENATIPCHVTATAAERDIPTVIVQDFWASGLSVVWETLPNKMCVQDILAKDLVYQAWPQMKVLGNEIVITGQPAFDNLKTVDCDEARETLRKMYELKEDWPIIHYSGGFKGTAESVACLVEALNRLKQPIYLFTRLHPRMTDPNASAEWKAEGYRYQELNPQLLYGKSIDSSDKKISDLVNAASNIVVGTYPTMIVQACYLRKACLSIMNESAQEFFEMECGNTLKAFPPVTLGCCYGTTDTEGTVESLVKIFNGETLRESQEKHFVTDGKSTERVAQLVTDL